MISASTLAGLDDLPGHLAGYGPIPADMAALLAAEAQATTGPPSSPGSRPGSPPDAHGLLDGVPGDAGSGGGSGAGSRAHPYRATLRDDVTWRRLVTDPVSGLLSDYSTTAYRPGKVLRAAVEARERQCTFIGCRQPASVCELDHIAPYDHTRPNSTNAAGRGQTRAFNLHPLCKAHHDLKTRGVITPLREEGTEGGTYSGRITWVLTTTGHTAWHDADPLDPAIAARNLGLPNYYPATPATPGDDLHDDPHDDTPPHF
jgi:hypothetical protein